MLTKVMTPKEVTEFYKIPEGTLRKYRVSGKGFKYIKIGGRILYRVEDIETYIQHHTFGSTTEQQNSA